MASRAKNHKSTGRRAPDAISLLTEDHRKVKRLLSALDNTTERASSRRERLFAEIENELNIHSKVEEEIFYPAYKEAVHKSDQHLYYESLEEHHLVDVVLPEMKASSADSEEFSAKAKVLKDLVEHHAEEEEAEMFPKARKMMGQIELRELGEQIEMRKEQLQSGLMTCAAKTAGYALGTVISRVTNNTKNNRKKRAA